MATETLQQYKERIARSGGLGRAASMTPEERKKIARRAALARWSKPGAKKAGTGA